MSEQDNSAEGAQGGADDLSDLTAGAAELDGASQAQAKAVAVAKASEEQAQAAAMVDDLVQVLQMARGMAGAAFGWWPQFAAVWNDDVLRGIATNGAVLMVRHGLTLGELMTKIGPYLGLLAAVAPAAVATYKAVQERKAQGQPVRPVPPADVVTT